MLRSCSYFLYIVIMYTFTIITPTTVDFILPPPLFLCFSLFTLPFSLSHSLLSSCPLSLSLSCPLALSLSLSQLVEEFAIDKSLFPQRKMFGSHKKEQIVELQSRLSVYLGKLLLQFSLPPVVLLRFLDYKFSVSNRTHFILKLLGCIYLMLCVCVCSGVTFCLC